MVSLNSVQQLSSIWRISLFIDLVHNSSRIPNVYADYLRPFCQDLFMSWVIALDQGYINLVSLIGKKKKAVCMIWTSYLLSCLCYKWAWSRGSQTAEKMTAHRRVTGIETYHRLWLFWKKRYRNFSFIDI